MTKKSNRNNPTSANNKEEVQTFESDDYKRERPQRRKVYERIRESDIPKDVVAEFAKDGYTLRWVRWSMKGEIDYRYINRREQEGYEFVKAGELPESFKRALRLKDTPVVEGLVTNGGDLCLMKIDTDLRQSRIEFFDRKARTEQDAVDVHVLEKKHGLKNLGSKSRTMMKEPSFRD